jgi:hypothetical protein
MCTDAWAKRPQYNLSYNVEPENRDIYKNLAPMDPRNRRVREIVRYAKKTALKAGYPLTGRDLDKYSFGGAHYDIDTKVYQNDRYYMIMLNPRTDVTSHNLQISIEKKTNRVIAILLGG